MAEDGVLLDWFRKPHKSFGTTYRILNMIVLLQIATIVLSRGDVYLLGEAYAFGVVWSFSLKALGVLVLRYQRHDQEYKLPFNFRIAGVRSRSALAPPLCCCCVAIANLFSKEYATMYGVAFTLVVYALFMISERINAKKRKLTATIAAGRIQPGSSAADELRHFACASRLRPGGGPRFHNMWHLNRVLEKTNMRRHDIVVMTVRHLHWRGRIRPADDQLFAGYEQELFSHVVTLAEKEGKTVELLVVPCH